MCVVWGWGWADEDVFSDEGGVCDGAIMYWDGVIV